MLAKVRCGNHPLSIVTGIHHNIELLDGKCSRCDKIEDETRFSVECPPYDLTRNNFFS